MKKSNVLVALFACVLALAFFAGCSADFDFQSRSSVAVAPVTYSTAPSLYNLVLEGYNGGDPGPICFQEGWLTTSANKAKYYNGTKIYLITLSGTELIENQATGILTDLKSGFNLNSPYLQNVVKEVSEHIPAGSNLIFAGHSLGGMIAQQVSADSTIKANYNVLNVVTFGSPLLSEGSREGTLKRLCDISDIVPLASGSTFNNSKKQWTEREVEDGGYGHEIRNGWDLTCALVRAATGTRDVTGPHCDSYALTDVWGAYDALGFKNGNAVIVTDENTKTFYQNLTSGNN